MWSNFQMHYINYRVLWSRPDTAGAFGPCCVFHSRTITPRSVASESFSNEPTLSQVEISRPRSDTTAAALHHVLALFTTPSSIINRLANMFFATPSSIINRLANNFQFLKKTGNCWPTG